MRCISMRSAAPVRNDRVQPSPPSACRTVQRASGCCARRLSATITSVPDRSRREPASRSDSNGQSGPESQDAVPPRSAGCTRCRRSGGRGCRGRENRRSRTTTHQFGNPGRVLLHRRETADVPRGGPCDREWARTLSNALGLKTGELRCTPSSRTALREWMHGTLYLSTACAMVQSM